jgi:hypothetical protein
VIEAELTQLASCSLWLASPRRSPGRSRPDIATDISGAEPSLFEPMLDRVQSLSEGSVRFLVALKLYFAASPGARRTQYHYPDHHHDLL